MLIFDGQIDGQILGPPYSHSLEPSALYSGTAGSSRFFTAIRKDAGLCCGSRLRKGEVFARDLKGKGLGTQGIMSVRGAHGRLASL